MTPNLDISKVIGLIMENPKLIEEISTLARGSAQEEKVLEPHLEVENEAVEKKSEEPIQESVESSSMIRERGYGTKNRSQLLGALKPYVSRERAQAIDSMLSIVEILDVMKGR